MALKKGTWSPEEDKKLTDYITRYGIWNWRKMPEPAGLSRTGKSCRLRWVNYLSPTVKRGKFTCEEDETITRMHQALGNKWSTIAAALPGRSDNEIKNHWHTHLQRRPMKLIQKKQQVNSTVIDANILNPSKLNSPLPEYNYVEPPVLPFPYILDSSAEATSSSTSLEDSVSQQKTEGSFYFPNYFTEDSYSDNQKEVLFDKSPGPTLSEFWDPEPMSPFGFHDSSYKFLDPWSNIPVTDGVDGVFIDSIFQF